MASRSATCILALGMLVAFSGCINPTTGDDTSFEYATAPPGCDIALHSHIDRLYANLLDAADHDDLNVSLQTPTPGLPLAYPPGTDRPHVELTGIQWTPHPHTTHDQEHLLITTHPTNTAEDPLLRGSFDEAHDQNMLKNLTTTFLTHTTNLDDDAIQNATEHFLATHPDTRTVPTHDGERVNLTQHEIPLDAPWTTDTLHTPTDLAPHNPAPGATEHITLDHDDWTYWIHLGHATVNHTDHNDATLHVDALDRATLTIHTPKNVTSDEVEAILEPYQEAPSVSFKSLAGWTPDTVCPTLSPSPPSDGQDGAANST